METTLRGEVPFKDRLTLQTLGAAVLDMQDKSPAVTIPDYSTVGDVEGYITEWQISQVTNK